eukprot:488248-Prymnesium_polylepis.1
MMSSKRQLRSRGVTWGQREDAEFEAAAAAITWGHAGSHWFARGHMWYERSCRSGSCGEGGAALVASEETEGRMVDPSVPPPARHPAEAHLTVQQTPRDPRDPTQSLASARGPARRPFAIPHDAHVTPT